MSLVFDRPEITVQFNNGKNQLSNVVSALENVKKSHDEFSGESTFTGAFADASKAFVAEVIGTANVAGATLIQATEEAMMTYETEVANADSSADAHIEVNYLSSELKQQVSDLRKCYQTFQADVNSELSSVSDIVSVSMPSSAEIEQALNDAETKIEDAIQAVDSINHTNGLDELSSLSSHFGELITYMTSFAGAGIFNYKGGDVTLQPFYNDLVQTCTEVKKTSQDTIEELCVFAEMLGSMSKAEQRTFLRELCNELNIPYDENLLEEMRLAIQDTHSTDGRLFSFESFKDFRKLYKFVDKLYDGFVDGKKSQQLLWKVGGYTNQIDLLVDTISRSDKLSDIFLNAMVGFENFSNKFNFYRSDIALKVLGKSMNMADKHPKIAAFLERTAYLIDNPRTLKNIDAIQDIISSFDMSKFSGVAKIGKKVGKFFNDNAKVINKFGKVAAVAGFTINTGISAMENWEVTKG
ncbi:MAG TPA: hypothetical protein GX717_09765, partial [Clostridiaceae bacterium]|nr:hypothetical protein [Clostridiaceae bacterium]